MDKKDFIKYAYELIDFISKYYNDIENYPVKSKVKPREIYNLITDSPLNEPENFDVLISDFEKIIMPGITHWQSPNFFAYFPANTSFPSILAEMLTSAIGAQCMKWETSPAAAELEERVLNWLRDAIGLPKNMSGVIQDTASTATLAAILTAREKYSDFKINEEGFKGFEDLRVYCSTETHSSIEKAVKIAGIGRKNLIKIETDNFFSMRTDILEKKILDDLKNELKPLCVVSALGTTGSTAVDSIEEVGKICDKFNIWHHIDAAYAGSALILPEYKHLLKGIENVDSFVFNPHKWLFTNFDCSAYFVKDKECLIRTFEIIPEYLKTLSDRKVNNYCDWGIPLGRRFRALKLWFVIRSFGLNGLREKLRYHISLAKNLEKEIRNDANFEMLAPVNFNLLCFRFHPQGLDDESELNNINEKILHTVNATGKIFISHTKLGGKYTIRMVIANTNVTDKHVEQAWELIKKISLSLLK